MLKRRKVKGKMSSNSAMSLDRTVLTGHGQGFAAVSRQAA